MMVWAGRAAIANHAAIAIVMAAGDEITRGDFTQYDFHLFSYNAKTAC